MRVFPGKSKVLYLASGSTYRAQMLRDANIPFIVHKHFSQEEKVIQFRGSSPLEFVTKIARDKIQTVVMPEDAKSYQEVFVLVADTLVFTHDKQYLAKPVDRPDVVRMLRLLQKGPLEIVTVAILEKRKFVKGSWETIESKIIHEPSEIFWQVPEEQIDFYLLNQGNYLNLSSGVHIEQIGAQYLKWVKGCYWSIMGLPVFAVRQALEKMGYLSATS